MNKNKGNKIITKISISIFSFIFFLGLLEIGLRFAGHFYSKKLIPELRISSKVETPYKILCIGDSYTVGGAGNWEDCYPNQLQRVLLQKSNRRFKVINGGECESNTTQSLRRLTRLIKIHDPDCVILLVGSSNMFNLFGYEDYEKSNKNIFLNLRIYKMVRILKTNIKGEILKWRSKQNITAPIKKRIFSIYENDKPGDCISYDEEEKKYKKEIALHSEDSSTYIELGKFYREHKEFKKAKEMFEEALALNPEEDWLYEELGGCYSEMGRYTEAINLYNKAVKLTPNQDGLYLSLGCCYSNLGKYKEAKKMFNKAIALNSKQDWAYTELGLIYVYEGKYDLAFDFLFKGMELKPEIFSNYYFVTRIYEFQSEYDAEYILERFNRLLENNPELKENAVLLNYIRFFENRKSFEKKIIKWLRSDLEKMVKICQENNIKLLIQNYPYTYLSANQSLKDLALKYSLPFVDNNSSFQELIAKSIMERYLADFNHCTTEGHEVMVNNICKILISEGVILEYEPGSPH